jgi:hypothetical protein
LRNDLAITNAYLGAGDNIGVAATGATARGALLAVGSSAL